MDLGEQTHRVKLIIRDRGSNFTVALDAALVDASIRTVLCNVWTPRMNAITERSPALSQRSNSGAPSKLPPTRPWLARNSAMLRWLNCSAWLVNDCPLVWRGGESRRGVPEGRLVASRRHRLRSMRSRSLCARRDTSASKAMASYSCGTPGRRCSSTGTPARLSVSA
jgi:hypothetical protein